MCIKKENQCPHVTFNDEGPACGDKMARRLDFAVWFNSKEISPSPVKDHGLASRLRQVAHL